MTVHILTDKTKQISLKMRYTKVDLDLWAEIHQVLLSQFYIPVVFMGKVSVKTKRAEF